MAAAARAMIFGARRPEFIVLFETECAVSIIPEARPAGAAIIFGGTVKNCQIAAGAVEHAVALLVIERRGEGPLGGFFAQHAEGEWIETGFPVRLSQVAPLAVGKGLGDGVGKRFCAASATRTGGEKSGRGSKQEAAASHGRKNGFCHGLKIGGLAEASTHSCFKFSLESAAKQRDWLSQSGRFPIRDQGSVIHQDRKRLFHD